MNCERTALHQTKIRKREHAKSNHQIVPRHSIRIVGIQTVNNSRSRLNPQTNGMNIRPTIQ